MNIKLQLMFHWIRKRRVILEHCEMRDLSITTNLLHTHTFGINLGMIYEHFLTSLQEFLVGI